MSSATFPAVHSAQPVYPLSVETPIITVEDFEALFTHLYAPIRGYLFHLIHSRELADELTQDTFVKAHRALANGTTVEVSAARTWLYRIAKNTAIDALRRRQHIAWESLDSIISAPKDARNAGDDVSMASVFGVAQIGVRYEQLIADVEVAQIILARMPPDGARMLTFSAYGYDAEEIADLWNITPRAARMRLMRARRRFSALYREMGG